MCTAVAQINVVNDIADRDLDLIDKPWRPMPSREISLRSALTAATVLGFVTLYLSWLTGLGVVIGSSVLMAASIVYSAFLKATVLFGNLLVATAATIPFLSGASEARAISDLTLIEEALIVTLMLSFEIVKTTADVAGDGSAGFNTIATAWGPEIGIRAGVSAFVGALVLALSLVAYSGGVIGFLFGVTFTSLVVSPVIRCYYRSSQPGALAEARALALFQAMRKAWKFCFLCLIVLEFRRR